MRFEKNFNNILFKLSASYVAIIIFSVLLIGTLAGMVFKSHSNRQIISTNEIVLGDMREFIDKDILTKADEVYLRLVVEGSENSLFSKFIQKDEIKDYREMNNMKKQLEELQVLNSEWMSDMAVYFLKSDVVISSRGILYQKGEPEERRPAWINGKIECENGFAYYPTEDYASELYERRERICMLVRTYPVRTSLNNETAYIMFGVKESAISEILKKTDGKTENNVLLIVDEYGNVISSSKDFEKYSKMQNDGYWKNFDVENEDDSDNHNNIRILNREMDGKKYVLSYCNIDKYNWKILSLIPKKTLFKGTSYILFLTVFICILALILGIFISMFFARSIYKPFKRIINSALRTLDKQPESALNEYDVINDAIGRMEDYNSTIEQNRLLIKYNLVHGLINHKFSDSEELEGMLSLCDSDFDGNKYAALLFVANRAYMDGLTLENRRFVMFKMIEVVQSVSNGNVTYFAAEKDAYSVIVIAACHSNEYNTIVKDAGYINDYMFSNYYTSFFTVVGTFADDAVSLKDSWQNITKAMEYRMFMFGRNIIFSEEMLKREQSNEILSKEYFSNLSGALNSGDVEKCKNAIHDIVQEMVNGNYSAAHCNTKTMEMVSVISGFLRDHNIHTNDSTRSKFENILYNAENVYEIEDIINSIVREALSDMDTRRDNSLQYMVGKVKDYIEQNLTRELTLVEVAKHVHISPSYLSKIFKDETGTNFNEYITSIRMKKAADMLVNTDITVEAIAQAVGYNTVHYFIKKFKHTYGATPKNYRMEKL